VEKQVTYAIYSSQAQAASVRAADLQLAERHGGDYEDVESFVEPPMSDDQSIFPRGDMNLVLSGMADILENIACQMGILLADEESSSEER
jgi:hypothetical protein